MARRYPRLRVTKGQCGGWHPALVVDPDAGPLPICHHDNWSSALACAAENSAMLRALGAMRP